MDFSISDDNKVGLKQKNSYNKIIEITECLIASQNINLLISKVNQLLNKLFKSEYPIQFKNREDIIRIFWKWVLDHAGENYHGSRNSKMV